MTNVSMDAIKELREKTGAGFGDCRKALIEAQGNIEKAIDYLREKGITSAAKKSSRVTKEGRIFSYIHTNGKIGAMVEINCETDFVARTDEFENLLKDVAMQVAAMAPLYVKREDIPEEIIKKEKEIYRTQLKDSGKPENVIEKIIEGKIEKFYKDVCLLEQTFIKDESKTIDTLVKEKIAKLGENIIIKRFVRFVVGE
ncbi:MAG: translation elongation factor Ts [Candidatus Goldbacteria bacterium]|nr:translation elongation factor Ts [Candidatus Goldiibacteriota bacterium]